MAPRTSARWLAALPLVFAAAGLALDYQGDARDRVLADIALGFVALADVALPLWLLLRLRSDATTSPAWLIPALLTPLGLLHPWALVPSHLGAAVGGLPLFVHWLTRYPNLGPINYEIALGLGCVVAVAVLPAAWGLVQLGATPRPRWRRALVAAAWIAYVPLLVRLDAFLWIFALARPHDLLLAAGPAMRLAALATMPFYRPLRREVAATR